jgi:hypothetical protein
LHVGTNHVTDNTRVQVSSNVADITFDFTASGTSTGRLDFFARGVLVGSLNAITDTVVNATSPPVRVAAATSPFTPAGAPGFGLYWPEAVGFILVMTPGGPQQQFTADELRITPLNPTRPLLWLAHLDVEAEGIPGFEILAEAERPAVPGPLSIQTSGNTLRLSYPTEPGRPYQIDATSSLSPSAWQPFDAFLGDGLLRQVVVPPGGGSIRFFRLGAQ